MQKWTVEYLRKCENRGTKNNRVDFTTKSINFQLFTLIFYGVWVRCDQRRVSVLSSFIEKSMVQSIWKRMIT